MPKDKLAQLKNKRIALLGLGLENYALAKFLLEKKVKCIITICDDRDQEALKERFGYLENKKNIAWKTELSAHQDLDGFDIMFRSPGWPLFDRRIKAAVKMGVKITSPIRFFFSLCPTKNIIGITGTKGKSTTSALIHSILKAAGKRVWLGGNIGIAPFEFLEKIRKNDWVVMELSSFQLEDMKTSPQIAVLTNFAKEHLAPADPYNPNHHASIRAYWQAKLNIAKFQTKGNELIINSKLKAKVEAARLHSRVIFFKKTNMASKLLGEHNKANIAAAVAVAEVLGIKSEIIKEAVGKFNGLDHRLEYVREINGVKFYDDSFATTPEAAITALKSFSDPIILIAGGADKGSNFRQLAGMIKRHVKFTVLLDGKATPRLKKYLTKVGVHKNKMKLVFNMNEAVGLAKQMANKNDVVLLSPACASFGMFSNYKERGELFKEAVVNIHKKRD